MGGTAASIAVARTFGPEKLGYYSYIMWLVMIASTVGRFGLPVAARKYTAEYLALHQYSLARTLLRVLFRTQVVLAAATAFLGLAAVWRGLPPDYRAFAIVGVSAVIPSMQLAIVTGANMAVERIAPNVMASLAGTVTNLVGILFTILLGWDLLGLSAALVAGRVVDLAIRYFYYRSYFGALFRDAPPTSRLEPALRRRIFQFCAHASVLQVLNLVVWDRSEMLFLKWFSPVTALAFYSVSFSIIQQTAFLYRTFASAAGISLMRRHFEAPGEAAQMTGTMLRYTALLAFPVTLGLAAISPALITVAYGNPYAPAIPVLAILGALGAGRALLLPVEQSLIALDRQDLLIRAMLICSVLNVILALALIPVWSATGAALCNGLTQSASVVIGWWIFLRHFPLQVPIRPVLRTLASSLAMAALTAGWNLTPFPPAIALLAGLLTALLSYPLLLRLTRSLEPSDRARLTSLGNRIPTFARGVYYRIVLFLTPRVVDLSDLR